MPERLPQNTFHAVALPLGPVVVSVQPVSVLGLLPLLADCCRISVEPTAQ
jgi:hypothetical protein